MSAQHTPGKLKAVAICVLPGVQNIQIETEKNELVCMCKGVNKGTEDALRLVACWNACIGLNPEAYRSVLAELKNLTQAIKEGHIKVAAPFSPLYSQALAAIEQAEIPQA